MIQVYRGNFLVGALGDGWSVPDAIRRILSGAGYRVADFRCESHDRMVVTMRDGAVVVFTVFVW